MCSEKKKRSCTTVKKKKFHRYTKKHNLCILRLLFYTIVNFVVWLQWVHVNRRYSAKGTEHEIIFSCHPSLKVVFHSREVGIKFLSHYTLWSIFYSDDVTDSQDFTVQNSSQYYEHGHMSRKGCCVEITPRTTTAMDPFYRLTCVKQSPLTVPPLSFINIRIGGGDEPMQAAPRGCLLREQHLQLSKYHQHPTCIHTHIFLSQSVHCALYMHNQDISRCQ